MRKAARTIFGTTLAECYSAIFCGLVAVGDLAVLVIR